MKKLLCLMLVLSGCSVMENDTSNNVQQISKVEYTPAKFSLEQPQPNSGFKPDFPEKMTHCVQVPIQEEMKRVMHKLSWCNTGMGFPKLEKIALGKNSYQVIFHKSEKQTDMDLSGNLQDKEKFTHRFNIYAKETPQCQTAYTVEKVLIPNLKVHKSIKETDDFRSIKHAIIKKGKFDC